MMFESSGRIGKEIARWREHGLIDAGTAERLQRDVDERSQNGMSFGSVLGIMAAVLVMAALLIFVAANWEPIPRLVRVAGLFAAIAAGYIGGAVLKAQGHSGFGEALYLIGAAAFGGSIALIGQMYHLTGDELQAILIWCAGVLLAAAALRSPALTVAAVLILLAWLLRAYDFSSGPPLSYLPFAAIIWVVSYWSHGRAARHLILLSVIPFMVLLGLEQEMVAAGIALVVLSALVFCAAHWASDAVERFAQLGGPYPAYPLIGFVVGLTMIQTEVYDQFAPMLVTTLAAFAGIVAALVMRGRQSALMRWLAYAAFTVELCLTYLATIGTMMDTAGLFLFSGAALAFVAYVITRIEKRISTKSVAEGAKP